VQEEDIAAEAEAVSAPVRMLGYDIKNSVTNQDYYN
jgi:hypothetical protein